MRKGFTLVEIMVAISIFLLVMSISLGSVIGIFDVNRKSHSLKTVMSNLNLAVETMAREMRFGKNYHCCMDNMCFELVTFPNNCFDGSSAIAFTSSDDTEIRYVLEGGVIKKTIDGGANYIPVTSPEVVIEDLSFFVLGAGDMSVNSLQAKALIKIKGRVGDLNNGGSGFTLQTLVSQRALDL